MNDFRKAVIILAGLVMAGGAPAQAEIALTIRAPTDVSGPNKLLSGQGSNEGARLSKTSARSRDDWDVDKLVVTVPAAEAATVELPNG